MENRTHYNEDVFTPIGSEKENAFLQGPRSRIKEFFSAIKIFKQFVYGFRKLHFLGPCITVFGSARFKEDHTYYKMARQVGGALAKLGFTVMTGGGPGIMEAANRGAKEVGGRSVGCNIILPIEQSPNPYLDTWVNIDFFFVRKVLLRKYSYAFIVLPGGFGTLDEFFEAATLIQTNKVRPFPIVVMGLAYHRSIIEHINYMVKANTISLEDFKRILFTDSVEEAIEHIRKHITEEFRLKIQSLYRPKKWLREKL